MKPYQIVVDTNVLFAGLRSTRGASYKLLSILNDKRWQVNISTTLMLEYEEILKRKASQLGLTLEDIEDVLDAICTIANKHPIFYLWRPTAHDSDDDFLIDLAIKARADFIITYNKRDLQQVKKLGIQLLSAQEFLQKMGEI